PGRSTTTNHSIFRSSSGNAGEGVDDGQARTEEGRGRRRSCWTQAETWGSRGHSRAINRGREASREEAHRSAYLVRYLQGTASSQHRPSVHFRPRDFAGSESLESCAVLRWRSLWRSLEDRQRRTHVESSLSE